MEIMTDEKQNILVIKHSALGDVVLATAGFAAIRTHHPDAHIVCLTTRAYAELLADSPYFNEIWIDSKPRFFDRKGIRKLKVILNSKKWDWIYDLQTSTRTTFYQWLLARPWPKISNVSAWGSHGYTDPERHKRHALDNLYRQMETAGIEGLGLPDMSWLTADISHIAPNSQYALLVAGGAAHRPDKRWPADHYAALAQELVAKKITPVLIGTDAEAEALTSITTRVPQSVNLCGKTNFAQMATLARGAALAVGNDTGPMHIIVASGCPSIVLFSKASNPDHSAPVGKVKIMRKANLADLTVDEVHVVAANLIKHAKN